MTERTEVFTFSITGDYLTQLARNWWAEREGGKAIRTLRAAFPDMDECLMHKICTGHLKLTGTSADPDGLELVDDDSTEDDRGLHLFSLDEMFDPQPLPEPRVVVVDKEEHEQLQIATAIGQGHGYANPYEGVFDSISSDTAELMDRLNEKDDVDPRPEPNQDTSAQHGWLAPTGEFYPCRYWQHVALIDSLGLKEREAEKLGWIKLTNSRLIPGERWYVGEKKPTQKQIDFVWDWCVANGRTDLPDCMKD